MSKKPFSSEELDQLSALAALADEDIDTSDIPEISEDKWVHARRPGLYRALKQSVTIRLDADVLGWFKDHASEGGYQTEINRVLRHHVAESEKHRA